MPRDLRLHSSRLNPQQQPTLTHPRAQIHGTCLGFQLLQILVSNVSRNYLLVDTDSVAHPTTLQFKAEASGSKMFGDMRVSLPPAHCRPAAAAWCRLRAEPQGPLPQAPPPRLPPKPPPPRCSPT